ncbi:MAG: heme-binding protein, partial [Pseudomonadota bacterium]
MVSKLLLGSALVAGAVVVAGGAWAWTMRNIETPAYTVERTDGAFEVRQYPELVLASLATDGSRSEAVRNAFSPLAGYIFARERPGEKIAMTAPVTQRAAGESWTVSFIMPAGRTLDDLPVPAGDVTLETVAPRTIAAMRFTGRWTDAAFDEARRALQSWAFAEGLTPVGDVEFAYYNDPFTPPFLRRNEVL